MSGNTGIILTNYTLEELAEALLIKLEERLNLPSPESNETEIVDRKTLCDRLKISEPTAITWGKKGKIPFMRIGSHIRYNYQDVLKSLGRQTSKNICQ